MNKNFNFHYCKDSTWHLVFISGKRACQPGIGRGDGWIIPLNIYIETEQFLPSDCTIFRNIGKHLMNIVYHELFEFCPCFFISLFSDVPKFGTHWGKNKRDIKLIVYGYILSNIRKKNPILKIRSQFCLWRLMTQS